MADIQSIYNRLNSGTAFTPLSVDTFGDWSLEAGDVISVSKDGTTYSTPAMQSGLKWNGGSKVAISSLGDKKREPLSVLSRQQYASGGGRGGYWNSRRAYTLIKQNDDNILLEAKSRRDGDSELSGRINVQAGRIDLVADESTGKVTPASIMLAINNDTSLIRIAADKIQLDGHTVAQSLEGEEIDCDVIHASHSRFGTVMGTDILLELSEDVGTSIKDGIATATVSGNTLRLYDWRGNEVVNFSKAVVLDGAWDNGVFTVTASGATPLTTTLTNTGHWGNASSGEDENKYYYATYATIGTRPTAVPTENTTTINAQARWEAGYTAGAQSGTISMPERYIYTTSGSAPSGAVNATTLKTRILQAIADSDKVVFRIDCGEHTPKYFYCEF